MIQKLRQYPSSLFYGGTLLSSVGSMTFNVALMAFMIQGGYSLLQVSLIIGLQRLLPVCAAFILGDWTDRLAPRRVVLATEFGAALGTLGILWSWNAGHAGYHYLLVFCLLKATGLQFQTSSRSMIAKLLSTHAYDSNARNAMWLNVATQGATLFAGIFGFVIVRFLTLDWAIWFDFATFVVNGVAISLLSIGNDAAQTAPRAEPSALLRKLRDFYRFNPRAAGLDALLALAMLGSASFRTRVAGNDQDWNPIFLLSYGLAVWLAQGIERSGRLRNHSVSVWVVLGGAFVALGLFPEMGWFTFSLFMIRDTSYWLILHRITSYVQTDTPASVTGSVNSARNFQMITILSAGEILVGSWQRVLPLAAEGTCRASLCVLVALSIYLKQTTREVSYERPRL